MGWVVMRGGETGLTSPYIMAGSASFAEIERVLCPRRGDDDTQLPEREELGRGREGESSRKGGGTILVSREVSFGRMWYPPPGRRRSDHFEGSRLEEGRLKVKGSSR